MAGSLEASVGHSGWHSTKLCLISVPQLRGQGCCADVFGVRTCMLMHFLSTGMQVDSPTFWVGACLLVLSLCMGPLMALYKARHVLCACYACIFFVNSVALSLPDVTCGPLMTLCEASHVLCAYSLCMSFVGAAALSLSDVVCGGLMIFLKAKHLFCACSLFRFCVGMGACEPARCCVWWTNDFLKGQAFFCACSVCVTLSPCGHGRLRVCLPDAACDPMMPLWDHSSLHPNVPGRRCNVCLVLSSKCFLLLSSHFLGWEKKKSCELTLGSKCTVSLSIALEGSKGTFPSCT